MDYSGLIAAAELLGTVAAVVVGIGALLYSVLVVAAGVAMVLEMIRK